MNTLSLKRSANDIIPSAKDLNNIEYPQSEAQIMCEYPWFDAQILTEYIEPVAHYIN
jgi:hypothetical protein